MSTIMIVFKKEIMDMFRDKKTFIMSILIPILLLPVLYGFMGKGMSKDIEDVKKKLKIAIVSEEANSLENHIRSLKNIEIIKVDDFNKGIDKGKVDIAIVISKGFDNDIENEKQSNVDIVFDPSNSKSSLTRGEINSIIKSYSDGLVKSRLESKGIDVQVLTPFKIQAKAVEVDDKDSKGGMGRMMLAMLLPMMLIVYAASSPLPIAIDLAAGEKERGTLEPLLTTKANRTSLLWGKLFAITTMGMITVAASLIGLTIALKQNPVLFGGEAGGMAIGANSLVLIGVLTVLVTMVFAALELAVSMYARSFKEAQTYLTPITLIAMMVGFGSYAVDVKSVATAHFFIPIYNVAICLKEIALGRADMNHFWITAVVMIVTVIASIVVARIMFNKEKVIFRT